MKAGFKKLLAVSILTLAVSANTVFAVDFFENGKKAFYNKDYRAANVQFKRAVAAYPNNINYRYYYAQTFVYLLRLDQAQKEYERIIEQAPTSKAAKLSAIGIAKIQDYKIKEKNNYNLAYSHKLSNKDKIRAELLQGIGENYINNATDSGQIIRWNINKMPLKIAFSGTDKSSGFLGYYLSSVQEAFNSWVQVMEGKFSYEVVGDPKKANIVVFFTNSISMQKDGDKKTGYVSGLSTPHTDKNILKFVDLRFATLSPSQKPISENEMYNTALHEIGHALGILGHSSNKDDVMYPVSTDENNDVKSKLTERDINTMKLVYRLDADISNFDPDKVPTQKSSKNGVVLGSTDIRLESKLQEAKDYVKRVPYHPISWTSLGTAYSNMNNYQEAITSYKKAVGLDPNYIKAREGLANAYRDLGDFTNAVIEYQNLIAKNPQNIAYSYNLALIYVNDKKYQDAKNIINTLLIKNPEAKLNENINKLLLELNNKKEQNQ